MLDIVISVKRNEITYTPEKRKLKTHIQLAMGEERRKRMKKTTRATNLDVWSTTFVENDSAF